MYAKKLMFLTILVAALAIPSIAPAQAGPPPFMPPGPGFGPGPVPPPLMMALRAAGLTSAQETQLHQIMDDDRADTESLMNQLHSIHDQIANKLLGPGSVDAADLAPLTQKAAQIEQQMQQKSIDTALKIRAILTPDQLAKMYSFNQRMNSIHNEIETLMSETRPPAGYPAH